MRLTLWREDSSATFARGFRNPIYLAPKCGDVRRKTSRVLLTMNSAVGNSSRDLKGRESPQETAARERSVWLRERGSRWRGGTSMLKSEVTFPARASAKMLAMSGQRLSALVDA